MGQSLKRPVHGTGFLRPDFSPMIRASKIGADVAHAGVEPARQRAMTLKGRRFANQFDEHQLRHVSGG